MPIIDGTEGNDSLVGGIGADTLNGLGGNDTLIGNFGHDALSGGDGDDLLVGGVGVDVLAGGAGSDTFAFRTIDESRAGTGADIILDFQRGEDILDLSEIDADPFQSGDQPFVFLGTEAFAAGVPGQARYSSLGPDIRVEIDVDGNGFADIEIVVKATSMLDAADFVL